MNGGRRAAALQFCGAILATVCIASSAACHRTAEPTADIVVIGQISPQPARVGISTVSIALADASQKPVERATIMVEADMSHPGMRPIFAEANESSPGNYRAPIAFNMAGDWVVLLHIKLTNGRKIERQIDVKGVHSN